MTVCHRAAMRATRGLLAACSITMLSLFCPSLGLSQQASNRTIQRAKAVSTAASLLCFATKGKITEAESLSLLKRNLRKDDLSHIMPYLQSEDGTKAIKVVFTYLTSDCAGIEDQKALNRALFPYL